RQRLEGAVLLKKLREGHSLSIDLSVAVQGSSQRRTGHPVWPLQTRQFENRRCERRLIGNEVDLSALFLPWRANYERNVNDWPRLIWYLVAVDAAFEALAVIGRDDDSRVLHPAAVFQVGNE